MSAKLTERVIFLTSEDQRSKIDEQATQYGSLGEFMRQAADLLILSNALSNQKHDTNTQTANG